MLTIHEYFNEPYHIYKIVHDIDLKGETLNILEGCTLDFLGGSISNGTISGKGLKIYSSKNYKIFSNIKLNGSFIGENKIEFYTDTNILNGELLDLAIQNTLFFNTKTISFNNNYIVDTNYNSTVFPGHKYCKTGGINLISNITLDLKNSIITMLPSDKEGYNIITCNNIKNTSIIGGTIIGDIIDHKGTTGEWGYGIALLGSENITIKNTIIKNCWGDGINIQINELDNYDNLVNHCKNINIDNVLCLYNRRQGISVEGVIGCTIKNSILKYTGKIKKTAPSAGIDIEPWAYKNKAYNIVIDNCIISHNEGKNVMMYNAEADSKKLWDNINNVILKNCTLKEYDIPESDIKSSVTLSGTNIKLDNCDLYGLTPVHLFDCDINNSNIGYLLFSYDSKRLTINNCNIKSTTNNIITLYGDAGMSIENSNIEFSKELITKTGYKSRDKLIKNSRIIKKGLYSEVDTYNFRILNCISSNLNFHTSITDFSAILDNGIWKTRIINISEKSTVKLMLLRKHVTAFSLLKVTVYGFWADTNRSYPITLYFKYSNNGLEILDTSQNNTKEMSCPLNMKWTKDGDVISLIFLTWKPNLNKNTIYDILIEDSTIENIFGERHAPNDVPGLSQYYGKITNQVEISFKTILLENSPIFPAGAIINDFVNNIIYTHTNKNVFIKKPLLNSYNSSNKPTAFLESLDKGFMIYDSDLNKVIVWNGTSWVNLDSTPLE